MASKAAIRIGISGWTYAPWRGKFFPEGLRQKDELRYAAAAFPTIEVNGTFYGTQRLESFETWRRTTPEHFMFSVKAPRFITHIRRLREVETPLANFLASGVLALEEKLGPILWQFPPNLTFDEQSFDSFLAMLPHDTEHAAELAHHYNSRLRAGGWYDVKTRHPMRHAIEIRHESFRDSAFIALLRGYNVALVCADTVEWPRLMDVTSDFIYCRLHGSEELYASGYDDEALRVWAKRVTAWARGTEPADAERVSEAAPREAGRDVFIYFDNDMKVHAPTDARRLAAFLRGENEPFIAANPIR